MAPTYRDDQTKHELFIAERFLDHMRREEGVAGIDLRPGDQLALDEPDAVFTANGASYGVEIVDCWPSPEEATNVWGAARSAHHRGIRGMVASSSDMPEGLMAHPSGDAWIAAVQLQLDRTIKFYGLPTYLILNASHVIAPLHDERNGPGMVKWLVRPKSGFIATYLCLSQTDSWDRRFFRVP